MFASRVELIKGPRNVRSIIIPSRTQYSFIFMKNCADQTHFINLNFTDLENDHRNFILELNEGLGSPQLNYDGPHIFRPFCELYSACKHCTIHLLAV